MSPLKIRTVSLLGALDSGSASMVSTLNRAVPGSGTSKAVKEPPSRQPASADGSLAIRPAYVGTNRSFSIYSVKKKTTGINVSGVNQRG